MLFISKKKKFPFSDSASGAPEFTPGFKLGSCYWIFSFMCMFCRSLLILLSFFHLAVVLSVFRFMDSDYPFGIFKFFLETTCKE